MNENRSPLAISNPLSSLACAEAFFIVAFMRPLRALAIYIAVVFVGGALLAPWLYWLAHFVAHEFPQLASHPFFAKITHSPFHRYVDRALLGLALIGLWPLLRSLGIISLKGVGLVSPAGQWKKLGGGFLLGFISLAVVAVIALSAHARRVNASIAPERLGEKIIGVVLTAIVVAVLEEILFRGALFGSLRRIFHWVFALVLSSMVYAITHFMQSATVHGPVTWLSGLALLPQMLRGFGDVHAVIPGFFNLTLAGMILALAYQRTGNLYFSIGLHAGWIFWLKSYGILTLGVSGADVWWWGSRKLVDGWFALPVLVAVFLIFIRLPVGRKRGLQYARPS